FDTLATQDFICGSTLIVQRLVFSSALFGNGFASEQAASAGELCVCLTPRGFEHSVRLPASTLDDSIRCRLGTRARVREGVVGILPLGAQTLVRLLTFR